MNGGKLREFSDPRRPFPILPACPRGRGGKKLSYRRELAAVIPDFSPLTPSTVLRLFPQREERIR